MSQGTRAAENISDFEFESIVFRSDRLSFPIELKNVITDMDIYEHIEKPYLTGNISFMDNSGFMSNTDILGAEKITIKIRSFQKEAVTISKTFYIDKVITNQKSNDNSDFVVLHLIEDIAYISNLQNVNRVYRGKTTDILNKVSANYLDKEVYSTENDKQSYKVIVPNLNPLEAMTWLANRSSTVDGYPFYLYSTLVDNKLIFADLGTMISQNAINNDIPYRYWQGASTSANPDDQRRVIQEFFQEHTEDLFTMINKGLVGSQYEYIDTLKNKRNQFHFDVTKDLLQPIIQKNVVNQNEGNVMYSPDYVLNNKSYNQLDSRVFSQIGGSNSYDIGTEQLMSYNESNVLSDYKLNAIARAMNGFLRKAPMQITVDGLDFIDGKYNTSTGNNIKVLYLSSDPDASAAEDRIDPKRSGTYLVYATQYLFKREKVDVRLYCVKLGNYRR